MREFEEFLEKFLGRYLGLAGVKNFQLPHPTVPYWVVGAGLVTIGLMLGGGKTGEFEKRKVKLGYSPTLTNNLVAAAETAAKNYDYPLAESLFETAQKMVDDDKVLGANSRAEEIIFPEKKLTQELEVIDKFLEKQPDWRDGLIKKALILYQLKRDDEVMAVVGRLKTLDPNNRLVIEIEKLTGN